MASGISSNGLFKKRDTSILAASYIENILRTVHIVMRHDIPMLGYNLTAFVEGDAQSHCFETIILSKSAGRWWTSLQPDSTGFRKSIQNLHANQASRYLPPRSAEVRGSAKHRTHARCIVHVLRCQLLYSIIMFLDHEILGRIPLNSVAVSSPNPSLTVDLFISYSMHTGWIFPRSPADHRQQSCLSI